MKLFNTLTIRKLISCWFFSALFLCSLLCTLTLKTTAQQHATPIVVQPKRASSKGNNQNGFAVGNSDKTKRQTIKPALNFSTFFGGSGDDRGISIVVDKDGNQYIAGTTNSTDLPTTNGVSNVFAGGTDIFIAKLNVRFLALEYTASAMMKRREL